VIDAVITIAFSENTIGEIYNIGNPIEISISDLAAKIIKISNSNSEVKYSSYETMYGSSFEDMERRFPNVDKLRKLGWSPKRDLDYILKELININ
jgi:UDP-glucose 4-epimerase